MRKPELSTDTNTRKGRFIPKFPKKYMGDPTGILYRSGWEKRVCEWCDISSQVVQWGSEEVKIPYVSKIDGRVHKYFIDYIIRFKAGNTLLVELKPKSQLKPPSSKNRVVYVKQVLEYGKNLSKWEYAEKFAKQNGMKFQIWSEDTLKNLGILRG